VYKRLFINMLGIPQEVGIIDTIKELEDLLGPPHYIPCHLKGIVELGCLQQDCACASVGFL
jgi:hypothetical protein